MLSIRKIRFTWASLLFSLFWYVTTACELLLIPLNVGLTTTTCVKFAPLEKQNLSKFWFFVDRRRSFYALIRSHFGFNVPTSNTKRSDGKLWRSFKLTLKTVLKTKIFSFSLNRTKTKRFVFYVGPELYKPYLIVNSLSWTMKRFAVCFVTNKNDSSSSIWQRTTDKIAKKIEIVLINIFCDRVKNRMKQTEDKRSFRLRLRLFLPPRKPNEFDQWNSIEWKVRRSTKFFLKKTKKFENFSIWIEKKKNSFRFRKMSFIELKFDSFVR